MRGLRLTRVRGVPFAGEALGVGDMLRRIWRCQWRIDGGRPPTEEIQQRQGRRGVGGKPGIWDSSSHAG